MGTRSMKETKHINYHQRGKYWAAYEVRDKGVDEELNWTVYDKNNLVISLVNFKVYKLL